MDCLDSRAHKTPGIDPPLHPHRTGALQSVQPSRSIRGYNDQLRSLSLSPDPLALGLCRFPTSSRRLLRSHRPHQGSAKTRRPSWDITPPVWELTPLPRPLPASWLPHCAGWQGTASGERLASSCGAVSGICRAIWSRAPRGRQLTGCMVPRRETQLDCDPQGPEGWEGTMGGSPLCGCGVTDSAPGWSILSPAPRRPRETEARALPTGAACRGAGPVVQCRSHAARSWRNAAGVSERLGGKGRSEPVGSRLPTWRAAPNEQQPGTFEPETRLGFPPPPGRRGLWALSFPGERHDNHLTRPQPVPPEKLPEAAHPSGRLGCAKRGVCG